MKRWIRNCAEAGKGLIRVEIDVEEMKRLRKADTAPYEDEAEVELLLLVSQRTTGEVLLGCPMDYPAELDQHPTFAGLAAIVHGFEADFPGLRHAPIARMWAGLLPYTSDTLPIIDSPVPGLVVAAGHVYGNSAGPMTGKLVAQLMAGQEPELEIGECRLDQRLQIHGNLAHNGPNLSQTAMACSISGKLGTSASRK